VKCFLVFPKIYLPLDLSGGIKLAFAPYWL